MRFPGTIRSTTKRALWAAPAKTVLVLVLSLSAALGQDVARDSQQSPADEKPLVRVNVDLVQLDVIVTDAKGNHISDLTPEEFAIVGNGKAQRITNFSFLSSRSDGTLVNPPSLATARGGASPQPTAPARIAPGQANRTIAVVVDDLGISERSFAAIHLALEKLVDQQVQPGDLVAITTTSGRLGALQRLTSDKRVLRAAVDKFRSLPNHRLSVLDDDFTCAWYMHKSSQPTAGIQDEDVWLSGAPCPDCPPELDPQRELENDHRSVYYGLLSISALRRLVDGLRELPGRKSMLLFSEGLPLVRGAGSGETNSRVTESYEAFVNHANRSGVTVNTIDPRGLLAASATAERGHSKQDTCQEARRTELFLTQQQLRAIAQRTGGISTINDDDLLGSIARVLNDQLGYYLIGYKPPDAARPGRRSDPGYRKIAIRVMRPGLKVRFHSSLYDQGPEPATQEDSGKRLVAAAASPFAIPGVQIRFVSRFWDAGPGAGLILDTTLQIDARDLTFRAEGGGRRQAVFDILAVIYGAASKPLDTFEKRYTVSLTESAYDRALREGLVQRLQLQVKQAGAYQIRGAVRDQESGHVGSASEFVEVPDLARGHLAVSGIALSGSATGPGSAESTDRLRFRAGETVTFTYQVLNVRPASTGSTDVEVRAALYRDGHALISSPPMSINPKGQADAKRLVVRNDFRLGKPLPPGDYTLQVTALDKSAPEKRARASQTTDFEVVE